MKMTYDDRYLMTVSDDYCVILWKVIDRDGRGKKVDRELAYSQEILIPKFDLQEKVYYHSCCFLLLLWLLSLLLRLSLETLLYIIIVCVYHL